MGDIKNQILDTTKVFLFLLLATVLIILSGLASAFMFGASFGVAFFMFIELVVLYTWFVVNKMNYTVTQGVMSIVSILTILGSILYLVEEMLLDLSAMLIFPLFWLLQFAINYLNLKIGTTL